MDATMPSGAARCVAEIGGRLCRPIPTEPSMYTRAIEKAVPFGTWKGITPTVLATNDEDGLRFWQPVRQEP